MRILIVDDEPLARERLRRLIEDDALGEVVGEASNGREALERAQSLQPDVVLLDIRMPVMDGMEAAGHLCRLNMPPALIFTTAYGDHALAAFEANAIDYLLKPIRRERLARALQKAYTPSRAQLAATQQEGTTSRSHLCSHHRGGLHLIPLDDVIYLQADHKYVTARHRGGEALLDESLKQLENEFGDRFIRIHRNALVARAALAGLERIAEGRYAAVLRDCDTRLEISRRLLPAVRQAIEARGD